MRLIPYGLDSAGRLAHVDSVPRGKACGLHCPSCEAPLVAKKGQVRQHHLAHYERVEACEGWLHATAKHLLFQRCQDAINNEAPIYVQFDCMDTSSHQACRKRHSKNLFNKAINGVYLEKFIPDLNIKPDIALAVGNTPKVLIEVVVSHTPEKAVTDSGMVVLEIHVDSELNLEILAEGEIPVSQIHNYPHRCPDRLCKTCSRKESEECDRCDRCGQHIPQYNHEYCQLCKKCVPAGYNHYHPCEQCGNNIVAPYNRCYCCNLARKLGRVPCSDRGLDPENHRHCRRCHTDMTGDKAWRYALCFRCNREMNHAEALAAAHTRAEALAAAATAKAAYYAEHTRKFTEEFRL